VGYQTAGRAQYQLSLVKKSRIIPSEIMAETKIPDATPGVITKYSSNDEQALLAKIRYNRLVDIFTRLTCYSLQNHYRTTVSVSYLSKSLKDIKLERRLSCQNEKWSVRTPLSGYVF